jgi:hypothetical protein
MSYLVTDHSSRADIQYAIHSGAHSRFFRDQFPSQIAQFVLKHPNVQIENSSEAQLSKRLNPQLRGVMSDITTVCQLLNDDCTPLTLGPFEFQEILISVCYRLLRFCPLSRANSLDNNEAVLYLGLLALMSTMLFQNGDLPQIQFRLLTRELRSIIDSIASNEVDEAVFLWLLFVCGISVYRNDQSWLASLIRRCTLAYDVRDWRNARAKFSHLPWIDVMHNKPGQELWDISTRE